MRTARREMGFVEGVVARGERYFVLKIEIFDIYYR
jgi:hypothetical protein